MAAGSPNAAMTADWFQKIVESRGEQADIEFKSACSKTDELRFGRVTRAVLGLANHAGGGMVVVGIAEKPDFQLEGLNDEQLATWDQESVSAALNSYADPPHLRVQLQRLAFAGKWFVILHVEEFERQPFICRKPLPARCGPEKPLRTGAIYVRSLGEVSTPEVTTALAMRDLLDRAVEKEIHRRLDASLTK